MLLKTDLNCEKNSTFPHLSPINLNILNLDGYYADIDHEIPALRVFVAFVCCQAFSLPNGG